VAAAALVAVDKSVTDRSEQNGGFIKAQGTDMTIDSEPWLLRQPPTASLGVALLDRLWGRLTRRRQKVRNIAYAQLRNFIVSRPPYGLQTGFSRSWTNPGVRGRDARLDLEVKAGTAFVAP
jgi:hypothetical protein